MQICNRKTENEEILIYDEKMKLHNPTGKQNHILHRQPKHTMANHSILHLD